jgi:Protein of unknown function (DUF3558)
MARVGAIAVVGAAVLVTAVVGCGREEAVAPAVPPIGHARDARAADPCALATAAQLATLGIDTPGTVTPAPEGRRCEWRTTTETGPELGITLFVDGGGLATLAGNSEPTTSRVRLAGYPALETFTGTGEFCQYDVGVAPDQVVMASLQGGRPDSCTALQAVLPDLVANLPALGS